MFDDYIYEKNESIELLLSETEGLLLNDIINNYEYYKNRIGKLFEKDVVKFLEIANNNTKLNLNIKYVSGPKFPDIVIDNIYGLEIKSTIKDSWKTTGNSIFEKTRIPEVKFIYLLFAKIVKNNSDVKIRSYEDCISGLSVQHTLTYKYKLDMETKLNMFDKLSTSYDTIRLSNKPNLILDRLNNSPIKTIYK